VIVSNPLLQEKDEAKQIELARRLGTQPDDPRQAEECLIETLASGLLETVRREVFQSLIRLRGGSQEPDGLMEVAPDVVLRSVRDILERKPFDYINTDFLHVLLECLDAVGRTSGWGTERVAEEGLNLLRPLMGRFWSFDAGTVMDWLLERLPRDRHLEVLGEFLDRLDPEARTEVPPRLARLGEAAKPVLIDLLATCEIWLLLYGAAEACLQLRMTFGEILGRLARNPHAASVASALDRLLDDVGTGYPEFTQAWGSLPPADQARLEESLGERLIDEWASMWRRLPYEFERTTQGLRAPISIAWYLSDAIRTTKKLSRTHRGFGKPLFDFKTHRRLRNRLRAAVERFPETGWDALHFHWLDEREPGFGPLTGSTLVQPLRFEYLDVLRFQYLFEFGRTEREKPLDSLIAEFADMTRERLLAFERDQDALRDQLARLRGELEARLEELARVRGMEEDSYRGREYEEPAEVQRLRGEIRGVEGAIRGERFDALRQASAQVIPKLVEEGVRFARWEPEGILGEFQPLDRTATIYTAMVRLAAGSPSLRRLGSGDQLEQALRRLAEIHEAAHGHLILAEGCDRSNWQGYDRAPYRLHEALATAYTRRYVQRFGDDPMLLRVLDALEAQLPAEYRGAGRLANVSGESLRRFFLAAAVSPPEPSLLALTGRIFVALQSAAGPLALRLGPEDFARLRQVVSAWVAQMRAAADPAELVDTCVQLFHVLAAGFAEVLPLLAAVGDFDWPGEDDLAFASLVELCQGPPVGRGCLRLRLDWIKRDAGLAALAGLQDLHNMASLGLPDYQEAVKRAGVDPHGPLYALLMPRSAAREPKS
jgi:hypothetical protein